VTSDIFQQVRDGFAFVAARARHVSIDMDRLEEYARGLPRARLANVLDESHHYIGGLEDTAGYILTLDAINFGSGYKPGLAAEGWEMLEDSIYYMVSTQLKRRFEEAPFTPARAAALAREDVRALLRLPRGPASDEFAALCAASLNELGAHVAAEYEDSWLAFTGAARGSAAALAAQLAALPHFADAALYEGRQIPFYKRAQIAAADLHLAFGKLGCALFSDMGEVTMFADNGVPHVLHVDGVLAYAPDLAARIAAGVEIPAGSAEEIELRACAGHAVELLAAAVSGGKEGGREGGGEALRPVDIDHILWHRSVEAPHYRNSEPHRTRTLFY
jgi:hypothetical protein